jgi:hypothetical protein
MEWLSKSVSVVIQLGKLINLRTPEDGDDTSLKPQFEIVLHGAKSQKTYLII